MIRSTRRWLPAGIALAVLAALPACGGSSAGGSGPGSAAGAGGDTSVPGVTADSVLLGTTQPLTGPAAPGYSKISAAMSAYFAYANENGGVHGRKVTLKVYDDGYNPTQTAARTNDLVLKDRVFALVGALGTPTHTAVLDFVRQNKVPDLFVASGSRSWNQPDKYPTTFGWQPDYTVEGKILADHVKRSFAGKTVCSFGQGDDFGRDGVAGVEAVLGPQALKSKQVYTPTNQNVAPQIGALQAAGCQVVVAFSVPAFTALALGTAAKLKYQPQWAVSSVGSDVTTLTGFLKEATVPLLEGMVTDGYLPVPTDTANSWVALFRKVNSSHNNDVPFDGNVLYGMAMAYTTLQALDAAGPTLNRGTLLAAVGKGGFTGPGLVPFRFSASDHSGYGGGQITVIRNGVATPSGPVLTTDDGNGPLTPHTETQPAAPGNGLPG